MQSTAHPWRAMRLSPVRLCRHLHLSGWQHLHSLRQHPDGTERGAVLCLDSAVWKNQHWAIAAVATHLYLGPLALPDPAHFAPGRLRTRGLEASLVVQMHRRLPEVRKEAPIYGSLYTLVDQLRRGGVVGWIDDVAERARRDRVGRGRASKDGASRDRVRHSAAIRLARLGNAALLRIRVQVRGNEYDIHLEPYPSVEGSPS